MNTFKDILKANRAWLCLDCGKCSSVCPITLHLIDEYASPRLLVERAVASGEDLALEDPLLWSCLTCQRCSEICPSQVSFTAFVQETRQLACAQGQGSRCTHSGMVQSWMRMMADTDLAQDRLGWITDDLEVDQQSGTLYFPGCLPYYDIAFAELGFEGLEIARGAVKILNALGIQPRILDDERCCGHDLYWQGERDTFQKLGALNLEMLQRTEATQLITTCPECAYTLRTLYPQEIGELDLDIFHLSEFLVQQEAFPALQREKTASGMTVTYQDPCRLGRYAEGYQQPRDLLAGLGHELIEMDHNRETSICCGTSCWSTCGQVNKQIQLSRLEEARETGADLLVTACLKCQIHLKCALNGPGTGNSSQLPIRDITTLLAEHV